MISGSAAGTLAIWPKRCGWTPNDLFPVVPSFMRRVCSGLVCSRTLDCLIGPPDRGYRNLRFMK